MKLINYLEKIFTKCNVNKIDTGSSVNETKLWEMALERYDKLYEFIDLFREAIGSDGLEDDEGNIIVPSCSFCDFYDKYEDPSDDYNCEECGWGKKFGFCNNDESEWIKIHKLATELSDMLWNIKCEIQDNLGEN